MPDQPRPPRKPKAGLAAKIVGGVVAVVAFVGAREGFTCYRQRQERAARTAAWGLEAKTADRINEALERDMKTLVSHPRFKPFLTETLAGKTKAGDSVDATAFGKSVGQALVARGLPRLPDPDLATMQSLKKKMAAVSARACPCFWDPSGCVEGDVMDGLARLTEAELSTWTRLSAAAGIAELEAKEPVPDARADFARDLGAIVEHLPPEPKKRLDGILTAQAPVPKAEQCFAIRTIFDGVDTLSAADRPRFARALANLAVQGDGAPP